MSIGLNDWVEITFLPTNQLKPPRFIAQILEMKVGNSPYWQVEIFPTGEVMIIDRPVIMWQIADPNL